MFDFRLFLYYLSKGILFFYLCHLIFFYHFKFYTQDHLVEGVLMKHSNRVTLCVSSQVCDTIIMRLST